MTAQDFSKRDFANTDWFSENLDSLFLRPDTILFIQYTNPAPDWDDEEFSEYEMKYLNHGDYVNLGIKKFGQFDYRFTRQNYIIGISADKFTWKFKRKDQVIIVFRKGEIFFKLRPISTGQVEIKSKFADQKGILKTKELTLIRSE